MRQFTKLFFLLTVVIFIAALPVQAQFNVTLSVNGGPGVTKLSDATGVADFPVELVPTGEILTFTFEIVGAGGGVGTGKVLINHKGKNIISVAPQAVPAHLAHGDTIVPVGNTAKVELTPTGGNSYIVHVYDVTSVVTVNLTAN